MLNEGNQIHNFISSSVSGTIINYGSGSGSDFLTSYGSGSGSTSQKVTVPTVPVPIPVPQRWIEGFATLITATGMRKCEQTVPYVTGTVPIGSRQKNIVEQDFVP